MNDTIHLIMTGRKKRRLRFILVTSLLAVIAFALSCAMLMLGNTIYPVQDVIRVLMGEKVQGATFTIGTLRFPRMIAGLFAGFAFGAAGAVFQTMLRNPLANPNVIGITAGSSAAAVFLHRCSSCKQYRCQHCFYYWRPCRSARYFPVIKRLLFFNWPADLDRHRHSGHA